MPERTVTLTIEEARTLIERAGLLAAMLEFKRQTLLTWKQFQEDDPRINDSVSEDDRQNILRAMVKIEALVMADARARLDKAVKG